MKVAIVHNFHAGDVPSGENEVVVAEASALERAGAEVEVISVRNDDLAQRPLHSLQGAFTVTTGLGVSPRKRLRHLEPDVIHVHSLFPYISHHWLRRAPAPVVATLHSYRPVCANGYLFRDGSVCTLCPDGARWSGVKHGCYRGSALATAPLAWAGRRGPARDPLISSCARLLVLSERARSVFAAAGVPNAKMYDDWHFVPEAFDPGPGGDDHDDSWLFVGRLTPEKGIDRLLSEWPDDVPLRVIGDGPLRAELEAGARGRRIQLLGRMERSEVMTEMRRSFGLVFPSIWYETFGLTYIEALAAGLPIMAMRPNVVADSVERDATGVVAQWGSLDAALTKAVGSFAQLRDHCRQVFSQRYTEAVFTRRRLRLYEDVAGSAGSLDPRSGG